MLRDKEFPLTILGIKLGLVGIAISLFLPVIEISIKWFKGDVFWFEILAMFLLLFLGITILVILVLIFVKKR